VGEPADHIEPWRDTREVIEGPAVRDLELAFAETWAAAGSPLPRKDAPGETSIPAAGTVMARVEGSG